MDTKILLNLAEEMLLEAEQLEKGKKEKEKAIKRILGLNKKFQEELKK